MMINKVLRKLLVIIMFFMFSINNVYAEEEYKYNSMICLGGYPYYIESNDNRVDKIIGKSLSELGIRVGDRNSKIITYNNFTFKYTLSGYFYENSKELNNRCYTYITTHNSNITDQPNDNKVTTSEFDYTLKACGNNYDINLNFNKNDKSTLNKNLINKLSDDNLYNIYSSNFIQENGKIKLVIKPAANSTLLKVWDRVNISVSYNGGEKGSCSKDDKGKKIVCTNIGPYEVIKENNIVTNDNIYKIFFYLDGVKTSDFGENVSDSVKQSYVDSCGGKDGSIYLGYINTHIIEQDNIAVSNPALRSGTKEYNLCKQLDNIKADSKLKKAYVSECYSEKLSYFEISNLQNNIQTKLNNLNVMFAKVPDNYIGLAEVSKNGELLCTDRRMGIPSLDQVAIPFESKVVYENYDGYWGMICIEDYYVDGGVPSLVRAGMGVEYENKLQVDKTCYITQLKTVQKKTQCTNTNDCNVYYDHGNDGIITNADTNGGPNGSFDSCIESCDGGKYTQQCINLCYKKNYSDNRNGLLSNSPLANSNLLDKTNAKKINQTYNADSAFFSGGINFTGTVGSLPGGYTVNVYNGSYIEDTNKDGNNDFYCVDKVNCIKYEVIDASGKTVHEGGSSTACNANMHILCQTYSGPPGCSNNAEQEYKTELENSKKELESLKTLATQYSQIEDYSISFTDSKTGYIYKVSGNTLKTDNNNLNIDLNEQLSKIDTKMKTYNIGSHDTVQGIESVVMSTVYDITLPIAYVNKKNSEEIIIKDVNDDDSSIYYSVNLDKATKSYNFKKYSKFNSALYTDGKKVFYTDIKSPLYNVIINSGKTDDELANIAHAKFIVNNVPYVYELFNKNINIKIDLKVGYGNNDGFVSFDSSGFDCYYGVYDFLIDPDECVGEHCDDDIGCVGDNCGDGDDDEVVEEGEPSPTPTPYSTQLNNGPNGIRYYYREIYLESDKVGYGGVFPNNRTPRWNWTGTIKDGKATGAASNADPSYIVDPEKLIKDIESKGDAVYLNESEYDYVFTLTPALINEIRSYNDSKIDGKKVTYLDFSLVSTEKSKMNYSQKIKDWYGDGLYHTGLAITDCNNAVNGKCYNY